MIRKLLPIVALSALLLGACGALPEPAAETKSAVLTAPWICAPQTYDPLVLPNGGWPAMGFCVFQPDPGCPGCALPPDVKRCDDDPVYPPGHPPAGNVDAFTGANYLGRCARLISTRHGNGVPVFWDYAHTVVNGWDVYDSTLMRFTYIKSVVIGPYRTSLTVWSDGAATRNSCFGDGTCRSWTNDPGGNGTWIGIPSWASAALPKQFVPAMIQIASVW